MSDSNVNQVVELQIRIPASTFDELEKQAKIVDDGTGNYTWRNVVATVVMDWAIQRRAGVQNASQA